jgi:hypothetical protein
MAGTIHLAWFDLKGAVHAARSYTRVDRDLSGDVTALVPTIGMQGYVDNQWHTGTGIDLFYEPGIDTNLRAAMNSTVPDTAGRVLLKPKADGIITGAYRDFDDWTRIRTGLCRSLQHGGGSSKPACS